MAADKGRHVIGVITTSRADFSIYLPLLEALARSGRVDVGLIATGMHLRPDLGYSIDQLEASGYPIWTRPEIMLGSDTPAATAKAMGLCQLALADFLAARAAGPAPIEILVALGDRFEMFAAVAAAQPFLIPVAHIAGGDETEGAIDNSFRHAITKLSHLHFVTTELAKTRVLAMGEDPESVFVTGSPALDGLPTGQPPDRVWLEAEFGIPAGPFVLATYHAETLGGDASDDAGAAASRQFGALLAALYDFGLPVVVTASNADPGGVAINQMIRAAAADPKSPMPVVFVDNFGRRGYFSALGAASVMVGNSSSGIMEAASFALPVVNIGDRQAGREQPGNVINVACEKGAIRAALRRATSADFRAGLKTVRNIYGDGHAAPRMVEEILKFLDRGAPLRKRFHTT